MKFYVSYFGCRTNQAEIQEIIIGLEDSGYRLTNKISEADFGIINTCSVTEKAEKDVLRYINRIYKLSNFKWIITGCTVTKEGEALENKYKNYTFLKNREKGNILNYIIGEFPIEGTIISHSSFRSRIFLKVQDGCNFRCAFCIVPSLRGKSASIPIPELVKRAGYFTSLGYREIVLTGINLSSFGYDLFPRENILSLIRELEKIKDLDFIRLSSIDPRHLKYSFIKELSYIKKVVPSFHFSFQSGSNTVLKRMKRGSKISDYQKIMKTFRSFYPNANFGADIIIGFPDESDKEFKDTMEFVKRSELTYLHIFPFSPRKGTKAALMEQLQANVVKKRIEEITDLNKNLKLSYRERFKGKTVFGILVEENANYSLVITENFLSVRVQPVKGFKKKKIKIKITRIVNENICEGVIVDKK